jgi:hypothetical protein
MQPHTQTTPETTGSNCPVSARVSSTTAINHKHRLGLHAAMAVIALTTGLVGCGGGSDTATTTVPGAPTIVSASAGDASASISFTAPTSDGGATISAYTASCSSTSGTGTGTGTSSPISVSGLTNNSTYSCSVTATNAVGTSAASGTVSVTPVATTGAGGGTGTSSNTSGVLCGISASEFNSSASVNATATYSWSCTSTARMLTGNGLPNHDVGAFPNANNPNTIAAVSASAVYTLTPALNTSSVLVKQPGYALNSVKFDPGTGGTCNDSGSTCDLGGQVGQWRIEALGQTAFNFGVDVNNAHVQPTGDYHYHGMPENFITKLGKGTSTMTLVGWAADGFPIYARYGYNVATDASSGVKVLKASYRTKTTPDANRPATSLYPMGTFLQDWEYVAGLGDLDACNGRTGVTPEFPQGIYHYMITDTYPFIQRCVNGKL